MENDLTYKKEVKLVGSVDSLSQAQLKYILSQMQKSICKIRKDKSVGTGFFAKIQFPEQFNLLPVLITCNHVLDADSITEGKRILISLNNDENQFSIIINNLRKTFTDTDKDITIIELKPEIDGLKDILYLDVDEKIYEDNLNKIDFKSIYIIHYENGEQTKYSLGSIKNKK